VAKMNGASTDFNLSEFTAHFNSKDIGSYKAKLDRLNISDPYNAPRVIFTTFTSETEGFPDLLYPDIYNSLSTFIRPTLESL